MTYVCPVCGYNKLREDSVEQNYNICPCCMTEFGLDDSLVAFHNDLEEESHEVYSLLREQWVSRGMNWFSRLTLPAENWNPEEQLKNLITYLCPVCGYDKLKDPPENHEICPCCGTYFGYEDCGRTYEEIRDIWTGCGANWLMSEEKPENWSLEEQLENLDRAA